MCINDIQHGVDHINKSNIDYFETGHYFANELTISKAYKF